MTETSQAITNLDTSYKIKHLEATVLDLQTQVNAMQKKYESGLRWGVGVLGAAVLGMGSWIFNIVTGGHLK